MLTAVTYLYYGEIIFAFIHVIRESLFIGHLLLLLSPRAKKLKNNYKNQCKITEVDDLEM